MAPAEVLSSISPYGSSDGKTMTAGKIPIYSSATGKVELVEPVEKTEAEWRSILPPRTFEVARGKGTEPAFTGAYHNTHDDGIYQCACCGTDLFDSKDKFGPGPAGRVSQAPVAQENVKTNEEPELRDAPCRGPLCTMRGPSWACL